MENKVLTTHIYNEAESDKKRFSGLTRTALKIIALATMACDHFSCIFYGPEMTPLRIIGRIAFPLFAYMIAEGAIKTKDKKKYALRLLIFGIISEIPFDYCLYTNGESLFYIYGQNVYFTLVLGLVAIYAIQKYKKSPAVIAFAVIGANLLAYIGSTDYSFMGVSSIILFYCFYEKKLPVKLAGYTLAVLVLCFNPTVIFTHSLADLVNINEIYALAAVPVIALYNGKKGRKINKYFFYAFYPGHMIVFYLLSLLFK